MLEMGFMMIALQKFNETAFVLNLYFKILP